MKFQVSIFSLSTLFKLANSLVSVNPSLLIEGATTEVEFTIDSTLDRHAFDRVLIFPNPAFRSEGGNYSIKSLEGWQLKEVVKNDNATFNTPPIFYGSNMTYHETFKAEVSVPINYSGSVVFHALYKTVNGKWSSSDFKSPDIEIPVISQQQLLNEHQLVSGLKDTFYKMTSIPSVPSGFVPIITQSDPFNSRESNPLYSDNNSTSISTNGTELGLARPSLALIPTLISVFVVVMVQDLYLHHNSAKLNFVNANQTLSEIIEESSNLNSNNIIPTSE